MSPKNGKSDIEMQEMDTQREPLEGEAGENPAESSAEVNARDAELAKLKTERDSLLRILAEMENARKRATKEQQEFREYALTDAVKTLLPILDSFERALQTSANEKTEFRN